MTSPVERGIHRYRDLDTYQAFLATLWQMGDLQLSPGPLDARIRYAASGDVIVYEVRFGASLKVSGPIAPGLVAIGVPAAEGMGGRWWGQDYPKGMIPVARNQDGVDMVFRQGHRHTVVMMPEARFRDLFATSTGREADFLNGGGNFLNLRTSQPEQLRRRLNGLLTDRSQEGDTAIRPLDATAIDAIAEAVSDPVQVHLSQSRSRWIVEQAIHLAIQAESKISVHGLSKLLNLSKRTLEYAFRQCLQMSPAAYLKVNRINRCRQRLLQADPGTTTVTEIAQDCGFEELGRFSGEYRRFFGEYPSQTLLRPAGKTSATAWRPSQMKAAL